MTPTEGWLLAVSVPLAVGLSAWRLWQELHDDEDDE